MTNILEILVVLAIIILILVVGYNAGYNSGFNEGRKPEERKLFVTSGTRCFSLNENLTATEINCTDDKDGRK